MVAVSVIIPIYQSSTTIVDAINSVLNQTLQDFEIIVVDDGSTDDLEKVLYPFQNKIKFIRQKNLGAAAARNNGIINSIGEYIAFLDADDVWLSNKLALQLPLFNNPRIGVVYGNVFYLHKGKLQKKKYFDLYKPYRGNIFLSLFVRDYIPMLSVIIRRQILEQVGVFDESIRYCEDYDLLLRIAQNSEFDYIPDPIATYRISPQQISKNYIQAAAYILKLKEHVYKSSLKSFENVDRDILERGLYNKYLRLALCYMREGKAADASQVLDRFRKSHRMSVICFLFRIMLVLPAPLLKAIVRIWDKLYQKPELGFV